MTYGYNHYGNADYRNEGWNCVGGSSCNEVWSSNDDSKYASCPSYRGRATVSFPIDISSAAIPDGSVITSVTIKIRVKKTLNDRRSVTVNLLSKDDTSRYTSRTLYPTTSIADYEVGTYTVDPLGKPWSKERINRMMAQVFSYDVPPNDGVRVYKLFAVINYKAAPSVTVKNPTGTVTSASPTVLWAYTQAEGDFQKGAQYKIFTADQQELATFNAETSTPVYSGTIDGDKQTFTLPTTLTPNDYYIYVKVQSQFLAWSPWTGRSFTVQGATPGAPGGASFGGVGTGGGGGFESVIADPSTGNAYLILRDGSNLLGVQQADFETLTDSLGWVGTNATVSQDTSLSFDTGAGSLKLVRGGAATNMAATSAYMQVAANTNLTVRAQFYGVAQSRAVNVWALFYDDQYNYLGTATFGNSGTDSVGSWTEVVATGTSPDVPSTLYCQVQVEVVSPGASEVHNVDRIGLMYGTNSAWSFGGHASRNLLTDNASTADDPTTVEPFVAASASTYSRVTSAGLGAEGLKMFKATYVGLSPSVAFVATGAQFSDTTTGTGFTLNKPAGITDGDLLVAYVASDSGFADPPPSGWSVVDTVTSNGGVSGLWTNLTILMRDGLAADPSSWVGNTSSSGVRRRATVVAYRGAASTATQLANEGGTGYSTATTSPRTPILTNTDPNAWRLTAFAFRDDVASGSSTANINAPSALPGISYVGRGANWWYGGAQASFTVNKPANVATGDLMLAFVAFSGTGTPVAPTGWTQVDRVTKTLDNGDDHSGSGTLVVYKRTATASEPSSWTSSYSGAGTPVMTQSVAYRNCDTDANQFIAKGTTVGSNYYLNSATVVNTNSKAWAVSAFMATTPYGDTMSATNGAERADYSTDVGAHPDVNIGVYDSNGAVSTGNVKNQASVDSSDPWAMLSWIGLLKPSTTGPTSAPNETERQDITAGTGSDYLTLAVYDTAGVAPSGAQSVYGNFSPGSGASINSSVAWEGFLTPAATTTAGEVGAVLRDFIDLTLVPQAVWDRAGNKITVGTSFLGSTLGTPLIRVMFYRGNELLQTRVAEGNSFNTTTWTSTFATVDIPAGTTRIKVGVAAGGRSVSDYMLWDRVTVAFGSGQVYRRGTGAATHPIFNVPVIEYSDDLGDGYGPWSELPGSANALLSYDQLTGLVTYVDQTLLPHGHRKYRARTLSYGLAGEVFASGYGAESNEIAIDNQEWWLKDPTDPDAGIQLKVLATNDLSVTTSNTAAVVQPLGADRPIIQTDGYKGDIFTITIEVSGTRAFLDLRALFASGKTLLLQSNLDNAWWVRPVGDLDSDTKITYDMFNNPLRFVKCMFAEVDPE